jgi:hypothetical protein
VSTTDRYAEWVENMVRMLPMAGAVPLGFTYGEVTRVIGPWTANTQWRITEFDSPRHQVHVGQGLVVVRTMAVVMDLSPITSGTHFVLIIRYSPRFGAVGAFIDRVNVGKLTRAQRRTVAAFAALVEGASSQNHPLT